MRYSISLSYSGAGFCGWQRQPDAPTVQQTLEESLSRLLGTETAVTGAGRTDTGVNASGYIAHFDAAEGLDTQQLRYKLNAILPKGISIHRVSPEDEAFHARFDATRREYTYFLHRKKDPFVDNYSFLCGYPDMDFDAMNKAALSILGTHNFSCFEKTGGDNKTSICTVTEARWVRYTPSHLSVMGLPPGNDGQGYWYFRISADRFLRNMVRAVVGTLIEVGRGRRSIESVAALVANGNRSAAGESVPGHALFLSKVTYNQQTENQ